MSENFFGSELLFLGVGVGLVFFDGFLPMFLLSVFALCFGGSLPKVFGKILLMSGLSFSGFVLSSGFFVDVVSVFLGFVFVFLAFSFKRERSGSNRTPPHAPVFVLVFLSCRIWCFARFGRASCFLAFFRGAIMGPARFWDSPGTHGA